MREPVCKAVWPSSPYESMLYEGISTVELERGRNQTSHQDSKHPSIVTVFKNVICFFAGRRSLLVAVSRWILKIPLGSERVVESQFCPSFLCIRLKQDGPENRSARKMKSTSGFIAAPPSTSPSIGVVLQNILCQATTDVRADITRAQGPGFGMRGV